MFKRGLIILLALALFVPMADAAGKGGFWSNLKSRIKGISPKKASITTAVGGVRGALSDEVGVVYWKGKDVKELSEAQLEKFNAAIDLAETGAESDALKAFEQFLVDYPDSPLRLDALDAVAALQPSVGEAAPAAPTAAPAIKEQPAPAASGEETPASEK